MWMDKEESHSKHFLSSGLVRNALECAPNSIVGEHRARYLSDSCCGMMWRLFLNKRNQVVGFGHTGANGTLAQAFPEEDTMVLYFTQSKWGLDLRYFDGFLFLLETNLHLNEN